MAKKSCNGCDPEVDETAIECNGEFVSENCVTVGQNTYLGTVAGDKLSTVIGKIVLKLKALEIGLAKKVDYTTLAFYVNDTAAGLAGLESGEPYKTPDGHIMVKL